MYKFINFMKTVPRTYQTTCAILGTGLIVGVPLARDTYFLDSFEKKYTATVYGKPVEMDSQTVSVIDKVLNRVNLTPMQEAGTRFFVSSTTEPMYKGCSVFRSGCVIGLPLSFTINEDSNVLELFKFYQPFKGVKGIDWESPEGRKLKDAMILTEQERAFVIARELKNTDTFHIYHNALLRGLTIGSGVTAAAYLDQKYRLSLAFKKWARAFVLAGIVLASVQAYVLLSDAYYSWADNYRGDYRAATLTPYYAEGGRSYYSKLLERNKQLRGLMGDVGGKQYTRAGNEVTGWLWDKTVPITARRKRMEEYVEGWEKGKYKVKEIKPRGGTNFL